MKTIKVIDLLVKMASEKKLPKKILIHDEVYYLLKKDNKYFYSLNSHYVNEWQRNLDHTIDICGYLNDEVEILEDILDKKEKEFLENLVRPFKKEIISIVKTRVYHGECECIEINFNDEMDSFCLPYFSPNAMYKNMELDKEYTIEELGL